MAIDEEKEKSYRGIVKGTAIFGGVQIFNILVSLIRGKLIAVFLGPLGMGLISLFTTSLDMVQKVSGMGLNLSLVKFISESRIEEERSRLIRNSRHLSLILGLVGLILACGLAPFTSRLAFGNYGETFSTALLGLMVLFTILSNNELAVMQGCRSLKSIAIADLAASIVGLLICPILYYYWGTKGIIPSMIVMSFFSYVANRYFSSKLTLVYAPRSSVYNLLKFCKPIMALGFVLMVSDIIGTASKYGVNIFVTTFGHIQDLGVFQAASSITNKYVGTVFSAMAFDYFPKLAAESASKTNSNKLVNQQFDIVILVITPILLILLLTAPNLIKILLSKEFLYAAVLVKWMSLGVFFQAASYPLAYIPFAHGDKKVFFWLEGIYGNCMNFVLNVTAYYLWGINGLAISFAISYVLYFAVVNAIAFRKYKFSYENNLQRVFLPCLFFFTAELMVYIIPNSHFNKYILSIPLLCLCAIFCLRELNMRLGLLSLLKNKLTNG